MNEIHVQYVNHEIFALLHIRAVFSLGPLRKQTKRFRVGWELLRPTLSLTQKTAIGLEAHLVYTCSSCEKLHSPEVSR